ncbi:hypothetical protein COCON_G00058790 [Conger conger]|uniref:AAA+ ATPase domain-containing protein n=1 Tax=Conger conger TaxID=82655 RepID=A0A9Q1DR31_CONCO|nr:hypothetical protein COCON_G00058790 [Conger conger]
MQAFLKGTATQSVKPLKDKGAGTSGEKKPKPVPWVEKYRPKCVDDVAFQEEVVAVLKKSLEGADLPNLLFYGPPGTGKTSTILAAARELYGPELYRQRVLELNASDERGIQVVREKVKRFAQLTVAGRRTDGKPCPPFKIIILDEADSMTGPPKRRCGAPWRRTGECSSLCTLCNYVSRRSSALCEKEKLSHQDHREPLIRATLSHSSRLQSHRPLDRARIQEPQSVCWRSVRQSHRAAEPQTKEAIAALVKVSEGDLRKAITFLQSAARLNAEKEITESLVIEIAGVVPTKMIDNLLQICYNSTFDKLEIAVKDMIDEGYAATQIVGQLHDAAVEESLNDRQKSAIVEKMAEVDKCLADGADEYLQMMSLCSVIMQQAAQST